jgi:hypothetical protein
MANGGGPNARQRKQLSATFPSDTPVSVIVRSPLDRGIATAVSWFVSRLKVFRPGEEQQAAQHLGLPADLEREVLATAERLRTELRTTSRMGSTG